MATAKIGTSYLHTGKGPFDAKQIVNKYSELLQPQTFGGYQYNGMIVGVAYNQSNDVNKVGLYYLYDPTAINAFSSVDNTKEENWHRLGTISELNATKEELSTEIQKALDEISKTFEEISDQMTNVNTDLEGLVLRIGSAEEAIKALQEEGISEEELYSTLSKFEANVLIDDSDEISVDGRKLKINQVGVSKLYADIDLIIHGGTAKIDK